jgi:HEAT repeat protein
MSSGSDAERKSVATRPSSPEDVLPAVQPPSAGFLLQLFLIPMMIVSVIVGVWFMFSWLASAGSDPRELVRDLKKLNNSSWQKAVSLANQLQDPKYDALRDDAELAEELSGVLRTELNSDFVDDARISLRVYLCRILGEFRVDAGMTTLLEAAKREKSIEEVRVRVAALEALAVLANNVGPEKARESTGLLETVLDCSKAVAPAQDTEGLYAELRSRAAFVLGVLGGESANDRLVQLLDDSYPNARYNAATGLARQGDPRCGPVLLAMLDPNNQESVAGETIDSNREAKRLSVIINGLRAAAQLLDKLQPGTETDDTRAVRAAVEKLSQEGESKAIVLVARDVLRGLAKAP